MTNIHSVIPPSFVCKIFLLSEGRGGLLKYVYNILVRSSAVISNEKIHCAKDNSLHQVLVCTFWVTFRLVPIYTSGVPVLPPCFRSCVAVHWCRFVCVQPLQMCCLVASLLQFVRYSLLLMNDIPGIHCSHFFWWSDPLKVLLDKVGRLIITSYIFVTRDHCFAALMFFKLSRETLLGPPKRLGCLGDFFGWLFSSSWSCDGMEEK